MSISDIELFNDGIVKAKTKTVGCFWFISTTQMYCYGCKSCISTQSKFGGHPYNENGPLFEKIIKKLGHIYPDTSISDDTILLLLSPSPYIEIVPTLYHYKNVATIDYVKQNNLFSKFFDEEQLTVGKVKKFILVFKNWNKKNENSLRSLMCKVRKTTAKSVAIAYDTLMSFLEFDILELMNWINENPMMSASALKLCKIKILTISILNLKFNPATSGLNANERNVQTTFTSGIATLKWDYLCDMDFHLTAVSRDGEKIHILHSNKGGIGVQLDIDNTHGGPQSKEVISFNPSILIHAGYEEITLHALLYRRVEYEVPIEVDISQHSQTKCYTGSWKPTIHKFGSNPIHACWSVTVKLTNPPTNNIKTRPLPDVFQFSGKNNFETQKVNSSFQSGTGRSVYAILHTPYDFKHKYTCLKLGKEYQLLHDVEEKEAYIVNNNLFVSIGTEQLGNLPLNPIVFTKNQFPFGPSGLKTADKYRGHMYSPFLHGNYESKFEKELTQFGFPGAISSMIIQYTTEEEGQMIELFVKYEKPVDIRWWQPYML
jgi:hypothetical protein